MSFLKRRWQWNVCTVLFGEKLKIPQSEIHKFNLNLCSLCLGAASTGLTLGWPETSIKYYVIIECTDTCFDFWDDGSSTIRLIVNLGACLGALIPACTVHVIGRRCNFAISAIASIFYWLILGITGDNLMMLISSSIGGFAAGLFVVTSAMYVGEISASHQRGLIGSLVALCAYFGILISTCLSTFFNHKIVPLILCGSSFIFLFAIYVWMIESPYYLYEHGDTLKAKFALKALRGAHHILDIDQEYKLLQHFFNSSIQKLENGSNVLMQAFSFGIRRFSATITMLLLCLSQMVGSYAMNHFSERFFDDTIPDYSKIIIASINVISVGICMVLIERIGRKPLLMISISGSSICCLILAIDAILFQSSHTITQDEKTTTVVIIVIYYASYSVGVAPILPVLTGEVFSSRTKTIAISICVALFYLTAMINQSIFEMLHFNSGTYVAFISFTVVGSLGLIFVFVFLPETKAKSLSQIQAELDDCTFLVL